MDAGRDGSRVQARAGYRISRVESHQRSPILGSNDYPAEGDSSETSLNPTLGHGGRGERGGDAARDSRRQNSRDGRGCNDSRRGDRSRRQKRLGDRVALSNAADCGGWNVTHGSTFGSPQRSLHHTTEARRLHRNQSRHNPRHHAAIGGRCDPQATDSTSRGGPEHCEVKVDSGRQRCSPQPATPNPPPRRTNKEGPHRRFGNLPRSPRPGDSPVERPCSRRHHSKPGKSSDIAVDPFEAGSSSSGYQATPNVISYPMRDAGQGDGGCGVLYTNRGYVRGMCMLMCPEDEMREREEEGALSVFEATEETRPLHFRQRRADPARMVKKYRRSGAGRDMHRPEELRSPCTLLGTVRYLVREVFVKVCARDPEWTSEHEGSSGGAFITVEGAYAFVEDRLRAVRQDLTVQGLGATAEGLEVLKIAANFYVVSGYLMSDQHSTDVFDSHLHARELEGVFASLTEMFFQARETRIQESDLLAGEDEYLCLQALHALARALSREGNRDASLSEAVEGKGFGMLLGTMAIKLSTPLGLRVGPGRANARPKAAWDPAQDGEEAPSNPHRSMKEHGYEREHRPLHQISPKVAMVARLLGALGAGNWTEFFRIVCGTSTTSEGGGKLAQVGGEAVQSPFAVRVRCLCHGMLLPVRVHALLALNRSLGKSESVPLPDLQRGLQMKSVEHVAGLCRALSLPVDGEHVVFKSVPARWKDEQARKMGYLRPDDDGCLKPSSLELAFRREDDWVGLEGSWLGSSKHAHREERGPCASCAGYGCHWCHGLTSQNGGEEDARGLWEASLAPS